MPKFLAVATLNTNHLAMCELIEASDQIEAEELAKLKLLERQFPYIYDLYVAATPTRFVFDTHQPEGRRTRMTELNP